MLTSEEILIRIYEQENKARSFGAKLWRQKVEVKTTGTLADKKFTQTYPVETIISPAPWTKLFLILFLGNLTFIGYVMGRDISTAPLFIKFIFGVFFSLVFVGIIIGLISTYFFGKQLNSSIQVNDKGLKIKSESYDWKDISQICIVKQPQARGFTYWLVIGLQNGVINRYDLTQFMGPKEWLGIAEMEKLATVIEYYKQQQSCNTAKKNIA